MAVQVAPIDPNEFAALNAVAHRNYAAQQAQPAAPASGGGLLDNLIHGIVSPFEYFGKNVFVNPIKETAAQLTRNQQAYNNAFKQSNSDLGLGNKGTDLTGALKSLAGNTIGLGTTLLAPEAKAGIVPNLVQGAKIGAVAGVGGSLANKGSANDVVKGALEGALGGGALGGVSGLLGKINSGVGDVAANRATSTAAKQAQEQAVANEVPFLGVKQGVRENLGLQDAIQNAKNLKLAPTPENMRLASDFATGTNGQGSVALSNALQGQKVNVGDYLSHVKQAISSEPVIQSSTGQKLLDSITNNKENNLFNGNGSLTQNANANDVMNSIRFHEGQSARYANSGSGTEGDAIGKVHQAAASYLKGALDSNPDVNNAIAAYKFSPQDAQAFTNDVQKAGGSPELAQHIIDNINNAKSVADLRSFQAPFVRMGKLANAADTAATGRLTKPANSSAPIGNAALNVGSDLLFGSRLGLARNAANVVSKSGIVDKLLAGAGNVSNAVSSVASKVPDVALPQAERVASAMAGQNAATPQSPASTLPTSDTMTAGQPTPADLTSALSGSQQQPSSPFDPANLQSSLATIVSHGGTLDDVTKFLSIASTMNQINKSAPSSLSSNEQKTIDNLRQAGESLQTYMQQMGGAPQVGPGTAQVESTLAGLPILNHLVGQQGADIRAMEAQRTDMAGQLANALSGSRNKTVIEMWAHSIPSLSDTPQVAQKKYQNLLQQIQARLQVGSVPATQGFDLTSALGGAQ